jgi:UDP-N-acetylglucosamine--N-acetylmuramyl-(pentapeptide) pyrophosphoryl-undecaprenol N-acetylglucosamine transferase
MSGADHPTRVVVTGGGSGGHTMPALAAIARLRADSVAEIDYIGSAGGIERDAAAGAGVPYHPIRTGKLRRARKWYGLLTPRNIADILEVARGTAQSRALLRRLRPSVVLATGGFVTVPVVWAARARGIPVVIHEQTVQFGLANRLCARAATRIALSTRLSCDGLRPAWREKATITGNPVRAAVLEGDRARAAQRFRLAPDLPTILVTGGALGAEKLNRAVLDAAPELLGFANVIHQCGSAPALTTNHAKLSAIADEGSRGTYALSEFLDADAMGDAYAASSLVVCRSGAGTTNELAATGRPAMLVPLVPTGGDEQRRIARSFEEAGAAIVVDNDEFDGARLVAEARALLSDPDRLAAMGTAATSLATRDAAGALAELVLETARG